MSIGNVKSLICRKAGDAALALKNISPGLATGVGIVFGAGCVIVACIQTMKLDKPLDEAKQKIDKIHKAEEQTPEYTPQMAKKDLTKVYARAGVDILRIYALPAGLGAASIAFIIGGHKMLRKENAAITAAYIALNESYKEYRKRLTADLGVDKDREYYYGLRKTEVVNVDPETGVASEEEMFVRDTNHISIYARIFDEMNDNFCNSPEASMSFLKGVQNFCNDKLQTYGHLFLNEVYDELGFDRSEVGQYVGWVVGEGDGFVDFGLCDITYPPTRDFVNGKEPAILLDFNVQGPIMHIFSGLEPERMKEDDAPWM